MSAGDKWLYHGLAYGREFMSMRLLAAPVSPASPRLHAAPASLGRRRKDSELAVFSWADSGPGPARRPAAGENARFAEFAAEVAQGRRRLTGRKHAAGTHTLGGGVGRLVYVSFPAVGPGRVGFVWIPAGPPGSTGMSTPGLRAAGIG